MRKILLVDDDSDFLQILSSALEKDFEVYKADGISQALKILDTVPIDAICSDFYMRDVLCLFSGSCLSAHATQNLSIHSISGNNRKPIKKNLPVQRYFSP